MPPWSICTCVTSFVLRVISDGVPKTFVSTCEKSVTLRKTAPRTSRPKAMAVRAPKKVAMTEQTASSSVTSSMSPPVRSALRLGRYRFAIACTVSSAITSATWRE